jgi:type IV secretory pathway VirB10-like protein
MEVNVDQSIHSKPSFSERITQGAEKIFYKEVTPLTKKRDVNWLLLFKIIAGFLTFGVVAYLALPEGKENQKDFHEKVSKVEDPNAQAHSMNPTEETLEQITKNVPGVRNAPSSLDYLYSTNQAHSTGSPGSKSNDSSMISVRQGIGSHDRLPSGTRIPVRLIENVAVSTQALPVIGVTIRDVSANDTLAIPLGSKVYGEASFDESTERGTITWKSIQLPDGRERPLSGPSVSSDGQAGVDGNVRSESLKNTVGQTLTRFIGAYADGAMERGQFGGNPGGASNGLKNAIAETAKDRAEQIGKDLSREHKWIELQASSEFQIVLSQPFIFREPGATYGN